jgi:hypothetical protein
MLELGCDFLLAGIMITLLQQRVLEAGKERWEGGN